MKINGSSVLLGAGAITAMMMLLSAILTYWIVDRDSGVDANWLPVIGIVAMLTVLVIIWLLQTKMNKTIPSNILWSVEFSVLVLGLTALWGVVSDEREVDFERINYYTYKANQDIDSVLAYKKLVLLNSCAPDSYPERSYCEELARLNKENMSLLSIYNNSDSQKLIKMMPSNLDVVADVSNDNKLWSLMFHLKQYDLSASEVSRVSAKYSNEVRYPRYATFNGWVGVGVLKIWLLINGGLALILQSIIYLNALLKVKEESEKIPNKAFKSDS
ncbi:TPA: hypothetical protein NJ252_002190 [Vibrio parahaemolyticus]|nr:hypothetical protein [Vibrio parahaemolyticus]